MNESSPGRKSLWMRVVEVCILVVVLGFVVRHLWIQFERLDTSVLHFNWPVIVASLLVAGAVQLLHAVVVGGYFRAVGERLSPGSAVALAGIPRLASYVPGKIHAAVGLAWLAKRIAGVPVRVSISVAVLLAIQSVAAGLVCGALLAPGSLAGLWPCVLLGLGAAVGLACLHPAVVLGPVNWLLGRLGKTRIDGKVAYGQVLPLLLAAVLQRLVVAGTFVVLASSLIELDGQVAVHVAMVYVLSVLAGFIAFFAPAGIGIMEGSMLLMLTQVLGPEAAAVLTVAGRIWQTGIVLMSAGMGAVALWIRRQRQA